MTPTAPTTSHTGGTSDTSPAELEHVLAAAEAAAGPYGDLPAADRARMLRAVADTMDAHADELVGLTDTETGLGSPRLPGELKRTTIQLRMVADVLEEGSWVEAVIDTPDPDALPTPRPDLRRMLVPVGPTLVFAASNFPFAFSVVGGDTASALAVGCPVVVKAHPGHPETSRRTADLVGKALQGEGAPDGTFALVEGMDAGTSALTDPRVKAAAFTGSVAGGRALFDIANTRPDPIPFYGELGSLNPVFVTRGAVAARGQDVVTGFAGSMTMGTGQFCTKPGLLLLPEGHGLDDALTEAFAGAAPVRMLNERIHAGHHATRAELAGRPGIRVLVDGEDGAGQEGIAAAPTLLTTTASALLEDSEALLTECFGPTALVVEYASGDELLAVADALEGNLTATVHGEDGESDEVAPLWRALRDRAGRLLWNGWPTGVAVTWAMQHGGPWPATTASLHTSVGMTATRRFLRPVAYQGTPEPLLPRALRDRNALGLPRRVNGTVTTEDVTP
ncbi:MAG: aldehyde dehydrogenase (NADP(+)) [Actinomycetes bacterium]